jgi:hypothetical protein
MVRPWSAIARVMVWRSTSSVSAEAIAAMVFELFHGFLKPSCLLDQVQERHTSSIYFFAILTTRRVLARMNGRARPSHPAQFPQVGQHIGSVCPLSARGTDFPTVLDFLGQIDLSSLLNRGHAPFPQIEGYSIIHPMPSRSSLFIFQSSSESENLQNPGLRRRLPYLRCRQGRQGLYIFNANGFYSSMPSTSSGTSTGCLHLPRFDHV